MPNSKHVPVLQEMAGLQCKNCGYEGRMDNVKYHPNGAIKLYRCPKCTVEVSSSENGKKISENWNDHELAWILLEIFGPLLCLAPFIIEEPFWTKFFVFTTGLFMTLWGHEKYMQLKAREKMIAKMHYEWLSRKEEDQRG
jgi:DNA-directed RNA polymerase subunit RPC12/RpoP